MAYNSIHSGPAVDAAVASLNEIQTVRTEVSGKLDQVDDLASQAAFDRGLAVQAKDAAQEAQTLADQRAADAQGSATAAEQARTASVTAKSGAEQARDAAAADAERAEIAAAQASQIAVGEFIDDANPSTGMVFSSEKVAATVQQVRDDLADPEKGAAEVMTRLRLAGAVARTQAEKNAEVASVMDFGAIGDGTLHTIQEWIIPGARAWAASLGDVQAKYPHVVGTADSIDWASTQAALDSGVSEVLIPSGAVLVWKGNGPTVRSNTTVSGGLDG